MTARTLPRLRERRTFRLLEWGAGLLAALLSRPRAAEEDRPHYSGSFGNTGQDMTPYDQMTTQEHDDCGAFWGSIARGDE